MKHCPVALKKWKWKRWWLSISSQCLKNNSFTYLDWWACAICFLKEYNVMYKLDQKMKIIFIHQTMHSFFPVCVSFFFIFIVQVDLFTADAHQTEKDFWKMNIYLDFYLCLFHGNIISLSTMHHLCEDTDCHGYDGSSFWVSPIYHYCHYFCFQNHESYILYSIETVGMHCKLATRYSPILVPNWAINYFFHSPTFVFIYLKQIELRYDFEIILKRRLIIFILELSVA